MLNLYLYSPQIRTYQHNSMPKKKQFNKQSVRKKFGRIQKRNRPQQTNVTSGTPEVRLPLIITHESTDHQENTHHVRTLSPATITDAASTCSDISNTKEQVYTDKLKAEKVLSSKCDPIFL